MQLWFRCPKYQDTITRSGAEQVSLPREADGFEGILKHQPIYLSYSVWIPIHITHAARNVRQNGNPVCIVLSQNINSPSICEAPVDIRGSPRAERGRHVPVEGSPLCGGELILLNLLDLHKEHSETPQDLNKKIKMKSDCSSRASVILIY